MTKTFKTGDRALSRDGHLVEIAHTYREGDVEFAGIRYLDGHVPGPVGGRVSGTEDDPIWEHRILDGKVVRDNADYYYPERWVVERGLRPAALYDFVEAALVYLGDDHTRKPYLPVSLRASGDTTWRDLWDRGLVHAGEVSQAAAFKVAEESRS